MSESKNSKQPDAEAQFMIQRIYIKDSSFEAPNTPSLFFSNNGNLSYHWIYIQKNVSLDKGVYEVTLTVTATVKNQNVVAFLAEVKQAVFLRFKALSFSNNSINLSGKFRLNILFPYARETITGHVLPRQFPSINLSTHQF